ncbi:MAG: hypothetical protein ABIH76_00225 [Candidatus Bathyarchaeota archaeon]
MNPFKQRCENTRITVYIDAGDEVYPICNMCWSNIADDEIEWDGMGIKKLSHEIN